MRYGIFGGSFNPPHLEHRDLCLAVKKELALDKIVILPCGNAPHKMGLVSFDKRAAMLKLLFGDEDAIIDETENQLLGVTNSARVLPILKQKYGDITFIIGGDSMIDMDTWIDPVKVMTTCPIAVVARQSKNQQLYSAVSKYRSLGAKINVIEYVGKEYSSTLARTYLRLGMQCPFLSDAVNKFALDNKLYSEYDWYLQKLATCLPEKRLLHSKYVVLMAIKLNEFLKLPYEKVFIAALLHDCAKYSTKTQTIFDGVVIDGACAHAFVGAEEVQTKFGISDEDIINAIRFHTTGRACMSDLERLIYLADYIEETRDFVGVEQLRNAALQNFENGFLMAVKRQYEYLKGKPNISPKTEECLRYYINKSKD